MMQKILSSYQTKDNLKIFTIEWSIKQPKAILCFVHGFGEHIMRYQHVAGFFTNKGFACFGYDRRGHGQSEGKRGHTPNFDAYLDEILEMVITAKQKYPDKPLFLYGHSMGGNLVLNYILKRNPKIAGAIVTGPWIDLPDSSKPSPILLFFARLLNILFPSLQQPSGVDAQYISREDAVVQKYLNDPLVQDKISVRAAMEMTDAADFLNQYTGHFPVPLLVMHGTDDGLTLFEASKHFCQRVDGPITFKSFEGWYHEIHNEADNQEVFDNTLQFLENHLKV